MKESYGVPNAQPFLYGDWFNLADGGDGLITYGMFFAQPPSGLN